MKGRPTKETKDTTTHPNKSTICGTICTNCPPVPLSSKQKMGRKSLHKLFVQTISIWVGVFFGVGCLPLAVFLLDHKGFFLLSTACNLGALQNARPRRMQMAVPVVDPCLSRVRVRLRRLCARIGIPATCYRTENAQIPKSAGESAGKSAGKKGTAGGTAGSSAVSLLFQRNRPPSTAPSSPPSSPLFPGTLPSTLPGTFGDLGVLSPVAGRWDSNARNSSTFGPFELKNHRIFAHTPCKIKVSLHRGPPTTHHPPQKTFLIKWSFWGGWCANCRNLRERQNTHHPQFCTRDVDLRFCGGVVWTSWSDLQLSLCVSYGLLLGRHLLGPKRLGHDLWAASWEGHKVLTKSLFEQEAPKIGTRSVRPNEVFKNL